jgi:hypothetical protein
MMSLILPIILPLLLLFNSKTSLSGEEEEEEVKPEKRERA